MKLVQRARSACSLIEDQLCDPVVVPIEVMPARELDPARTIRRQRGTEESSSSLPYRRNTGVLVSFDFRKQR